MGVTLDKLKLCKASLGSFIFEWEIDMNWDKLGSMSTTNQARNK
jgi:hypothetical protein